MKYIFFWGRTTFSVRGKLQGTCSCWQLFHYDNMKLSGGSNLPWSIHKIVSHYCWDKSRIAAAALEIWIPHLPLYSGVLSWYFNLCLFGFDMLFKCFPSTPGHMPTAQQFFFSWSKDSLPSSERLFCIITHELTKWFRVPVLCLTALRNSINKEVSSLLVMAQATYAFTKLIQHNDCDQIKIVHVCSMCSLHADAGIAVVAYTCYIETEFEFQLWSHPFQHCPFHQAEAHLAEGQVSMEENSALFSSTLEKQL